jgi:hypothetical protein
MGRGHLDEARRRKGPGDTGRATLRSDRAELPVEHGVRLLGACPHQLQAMKLNTDVNLRQQSGATPTGASRSRKRLCCNGKQACPLWLEPAECGWIIDQRDTELRVLLARINSHSPALPRPSEREVDRRCTTDLLRLALCRSVGA